MASESEEFVDDAVDSGLANTLHMSNGSDGKAMLDMVLNAVFMGNG